MACSRWLEACPVWKWKWNLTESSHDEAGSALQKKTAHFLQHGPLSARRELQSHPLAGQAQACERLTKGGWAGGPDGTYRDWCSPLRTKNLSHTSSLCWGPR